MLPIKPNSDKAIFTYIGDDLRRDFASLIDSLIDDGPTKLHRIYLVDELGESVAVEMFYLFVTHGMVLGFSPNSFLQIYVDQSKNLNPDNVLDIREEPSQAKMIDFLADSCPKEYYTVGKRTKRDNSGTIMKRYFNMDEFTQTHGHISDRDLTLKLERNTDCLLRRVQYNDMLYHIYSVPVDHPELHFSSKLGVSGVVDSRPDIIVSGGRMMMSHLSDVTNRRGEVFEAYMPLIPGLDATSGQNLAESEYMTDILDRIQTSLDDMGEVGLNYLEAIAKTREMEEKKQLESGELEDEAPTIL